MIPLNTNYFAWGVVEDNLDPETRGRVRVRIVGIHSEDKTLVPTDALPWSEVSMPANNASLNGKGASSNGLLIGTCVGGIFIDPEDKQEFLVMFSYPGNRTPGGDTNAGAFNAMGSELYNDANNKGCIPADPDPTTDNTVNNNSTIANEPGNKGTPTLEPKWMVYAMEEYSKKISESKNPDRIREYHKAANSNYAATVPWCSSFVCWCLEKANIRSPRNAGAISHKSFGGYVHLPIEEYRSGKKVPPRGVIITINNAGSMTSGSGNHVFFATGKGGNGRIEGLHGNWGDMVKIDSSVSVSKITSVNYPNGAATPDGTSPLQRNYNTDCSSSPSEVGSGDQGSGTPINASGAEKAFIDAMSSYGITHPVERQMLWAQCAHETGNFKLMTEVASSYSSSKSRYKGRGMIQVTGEANYLALGKHLGVNLINDPDWITRSVENNIKASLTWWTKSNLGAPCRTYAQRGDLERTSYGINVNPFGAATMPNGIGAINGLSDRRAKWEIAKTKKI